MSDSEDPNKDKKVVWILGSGFSKSLGGPLLKDLLSHRGMAYVITRYGLGVASLYPLYWRHLRDSAESRDKPIYWDHAEEFLDFLDSAQSNVNPVRYEILGGLIHEDWDPKSGEDFSQLRDLARRCVAAECSFASELGGDSEGIQPYLRWAMNLGHQDTIVTFNYDLVLETLGAKKHRLPFGDATVAQIVNKRLQVLTGVNCTPIYKLHGSVDWIQGRDGIGRNAQSILPPFIATPGPGKYDVCKGPLKPIWDAALKAIAVADVLVFLGYRFPPSDAQARTKILGALAANERPSLKVHTVLGPRTADDDTVRLGKLIEHTLEGKRGGTQSQYAIEQHPLYVEDFFSVLHPRLLHEI